MKDFKRYFGLFGAPVLAVTLALAGCASTGGSMANDKSTMGQGAMGEKTAMAGSVQPMMAMDPMKSEHAVIDRFSAAAGHLQMRNSMNHLPGPNQPVDFDVPPFVTTGLGPHGEVVMYYNFDVQSTTPAPIYVLFRKGEDAPVSGQLNIVDVIPGDPGYNDFWQVMRVTVPADYVANSVGSLQAIKDAGYPIQQTSTLVNCPIVPDGSTAAHRLSGNDTGLHHGWYRNKVVSYFNFSEAPLMVTDDGKVPVSPIYVTFNVNPGDPNGGPASGFKMAMGTMQTHNVVSTLPGDMGYSPLWLVNPYDNMAFGMVMDLHTAMSSKVLAQGVATVNCPIYSIGKMAMSK
jgi:hypothetical protein